MKFAPIAIVGQACVLPGALDPQQLWDLVLAGESTVASVPPGYWRIDPAAVLTTPGSKTQDHTWSDQGGYVRGFAERFDPHGFLLSPAEITSLDVGIQWVLHGVREALRSAGLAGPLPAGAPRTGLVLGNLAYPTPGLVEFAEATWLAAQPEEVRARLQRVTSPGAGHVAAVNRFAAGMPAHLAAQALNLAGGAFALDAACASSLYAIKLACDRLQDGRADVMVAGAVNRTDDLFIHIGFCALQAMSRRGQSTPFAADADGLVPAEGAAFVVLKRLPDAVAAGDTILGVIRGVGLSNDGNAGGFLSPSAAGQVRAMRAAYAMAGLAARDISLLECHATGTPVGDATELQSAGEVYAGLADVPIGSLKANLGHLITAAGAAGLIKVLGALRTGVRPPSRRVAAPLAALADSPFRLLQEAEPWPRTGDTPRRAAVSAFGFGGNNAHLLVEEWLPQAWPPPEQMIAAPASAPPSSKHGRKHKPQQAAGQQAAGQQAAGQHVPIAIVDLEVVAGPYADTQAFLNALVAGQGGSRTEKIDLAVAGLRFPPKDLQQTLPQQILMLDVARRLAARHPTLPPAETAVLVGMECDPEIARYSLRWRLGEWAKPAPLGAPATPLAPLSAAWIEEAKEGIIPGLEAAGVVGTMPNIPANRINAQLNYGGPSYTLAGEELSGLRALEIALDGLRRGEIDAALVGAVDLSDEPVHAAALQQFAGAQPQPGDAAVVLLLRRAADVEREGGRIVALVDRAPDREHPAAANDADQPEGEQRLGLAAGHTALTAQFGYSLAATGLLHVAAAALAVERGLWLGAQREATPWLAGEQRVAHVRIEALGGQASGVRLANAAPRRAVETTESARVHVFSGADAASVLAALARGEESNAGPARVAIVATSATLRAQMQAAHTLLAAREATTGRASKNGAPPLAALGAGGAPDAGDTTGVYGLARGIYWSPAPIEGELAFVFTPAAAAYGGMGRELFLALPHLAETVVQRFPVLARTQAWLDPQTAPRDPFSILQGCALLSQAHGILAQEMLRLRPQAMLGVSSGETNTLFASGAWHDMDAMFAEIDREGMYSREIAGEYRTAARAWAGEDVGPIEWAGWRVLAPVAEVQAALVGEPHAYLTMINAPADCLVAGQAAACRRVVEKIGRSRCVQNEGEIVAHHPALRSWEAPWRAIHSRETRPVPGVRFYSNARGGAYVPDRESAAAALTDQATAGVDFRRVVEAAYADGVRVFVEHGPRNVCSGWIRSILGDRPHLAVALDRPQKGVEQLLETVAQLAAAGIAVDYQALHAALDRADAEAAEEIVQGAGQAASQAVPQPAARVLTFPAHYPPVQLPPVPAAIKAGTMPASETVAHPPAMHVAGSPLEAAVQVAPPPVQRMAPPPALPGVLGRAEELPWREPVPVAALVETRAAPLALPSVAPSGLTALGEQLVAFHGTVAAAHQRFMAQQARAMSRLVELRALAGEVLLAAPAAPPVSDGRTVPPVAPVAAPTPGAAPTPITAPVPVSTPAPAIAPVAIPAAAPLAAPVAAPPPPPVAAPIVVPPPVNVPPSAHALAPAPAPTPLPAPARGAVMPAVSPAVVSKSPPTKGGAPAPRPAVAPVRVWRAAADYPGPKLDRKQLEHVASGKISEVLGAVFAQQDHFVRQVRMPMPPLLLADRVLGIDAEAGAVGKKGVIWTETDVTPDAWYLHAGHVPAGVLIEAGQADLLLVSYLGADFVNRGERVYRLLGCEATFHAPLPAVGETLHYEIHLDGYAQQGPVRLFFFHYDCFSGDQCIFSVREGQAGFFTDAELAHSNGVIWDPRTADHLLAARVDPPAVVCERSSFSAAQVRALSEGRVAECFGPEFAAAQVHVRTPTIARGRMLLFDDVVEFAPRGGPWGRGYLRAEDHLTPDEWFFAGHFKNDPCMPGTMMLEGCLQTMAFYMAGLGYTLNRDGWRFEPAQEEVYKLICRGQVTPAAKTVVYEVFVEEVIDGPIPTLYADLLCTVDGLAAFHCRRMGLRLVPAYPLESRPALLAGPELADPQPHRAATTLDHRYDAASIAACAWGAPSAAFGARFARFDGPQRCPRLPGPPYLYMTRVIEVDDPSTTIGGKPASGGQITAEYQIPPDAWYFGENGCRTMPYAVLLEAALQPCGWFASYKGSVLQVAEELYFRNLDGTATQYGEVFPPDEVLTTHVTNTSLSRLGTMTIVGFEVNCFVGDRRVFGMTTTFGFFPKEALAAQAGLPADAARREQLAAASDFRRELGPRPVRYCGGRLALPGPMLLLLDRVTGFWPQGGAAGLGRLHAEIDVDARDWFFQSHFMGDSVQPGSLGLEAMLQALQFYMIETQMGAEIAGARFEPIQLDAAMIWKYRGQVMPTARRVTVELEITAAGGDGVQEAFAVAAASLWVDGLRIYEASNVGMRIVADPAGEHAAGDEVLDPALDAWLNDHCPTWTVPALAMMSMADRLAGGAAVRAPGRKVIGLRNVRVQRWLELGSGAQTLRLAGAPLGSDTVNMTLGVWDPQRGMHQAVAAGDVVMAEHWPLPPGAWPSVTKGRPDLAPEPDPYTAGVLFHGPAYQLLTALWIDGAGASYLLDLQASGVPLGTLNQGLLDAATHGIPHDALWRWSDEIPRTVAAYPIALTAAIYGPTPTRGLVRCEARFGGFRGGDRQFPVVHVQIIRDETVWAELEIVEMLLPKGPLGTVEPSARRAFLAEGQYVEGVALSQFDGAATRLDAAQVKASDWLPGTVAAIYGVAPRSSGASAAGLDEVSALVRQVAIREHAARQLKVHPRLVLVWDENTEIVQVAAAARPLNRHRVRVGQDGASWHITDAPEASEAGAAGIDVAGVQAFWQARAASAGTLVEDLTLALLRRFVRSVEIADPAAYTAVAGQGVLYLANHQLDIESVLFVAMIGSLQGTVTTAIARRELHESWVGPYFDICFAHPQIHDMNMLLLIDRESPEAVWAALAGAVEGAGVRANSLLVHVEGKHALKAGQPVEVVSTALIDLAVANGVPIVPLRFAGGLPQEQVAAPLPFPAGYGQQDFRIGAPILPATLAGLPSAARKEVVLRALNGFTEPAGGEQPNAGDPQFAARVAAWRDAQGVSEVQAALWCVLDEAAQVPSSGPDQEAQVSAETQVLRAFVQGETATGAALLAAISPIRRRWLVQAAAELFGLHVALED